MQQTDLDIAKPLFKTDLGHGRGVGGGVLEWVLAEYCTKTRECRQQGEGSTTNYNYI